MKNVLSLVVIVSLLGLGSCVHAKDTRAQEQEASSAAKKDNDAKKKSEDSKSDDEKKITARPPTPETITTSKTTKQMFKAEGLRKLQNALATKATKVDENGRLDSETQEALRAYQEKEGLPATGLPDYETLRRLGLKPDEIFHRDPPGERVGVQ